MRCELLSPGELADWAACIPQELFVELMNGTEGIYALGVWFLGEAQGALVWEEDGQSVALESIYIRPQARRLGLGTALIRRFVQETRSEEREISVSYVEEGERCLLTPFLRDNGFFVDTAAFPAGTVTLRQLNEELLPQLRTNRSGVRPIWQLSVRERGVCEKWLKEQLALPMQPYLSAEPASFVAIRGGEVQGAVLLRRQEKGIALDYCWIMQSNPIVLAKLLACAIEHLDELYAPETMVRMTLSTTQAQALFERLFGQTEETTCFCSGIYGNDREQGGQEWTERV